MLIHRVCWFVCMWKLSSGPSDVDCSGHKPTVDKSTETDPSNKKAAAEKCRECGDEERAIFWSFKQGVYFAYKWR